MNSGVYRTQPRLMNDEAHFVGDTMDRGYERLEEKLALVGAAIERVGGD